MTINVLQELQALKDTAALPTLAQQDDELLSQLGRDARDFLDYDVLYRTVVTKEFRLAAILVELGIEVLNPAAILTYQQKIGRPTDYLMRLVSSNEYGSPDEEDSDEADDEESSQGPRFRWRRLDLSDYNAPIPAHVLQKAVDIKKRLPSVDFSIERVERYTDPFLVATFREESFYIDVWNEPKFEGREIVKTTKKKVR